jgi:hypothetical protein
MPPLEQAIRPFVGQDVAPVGFTNPGTVGVPPVRVAIGQKASAPKTFNFSINITTTTYISNDNAESPPGEGW